VAVRIGGVRTNFRMPDVLSFGLGGGSHVQPNPLQVGPQSVGYEITSRALVFGGSELTATDVAVAAGLADMGDRSRVAHRIAGCRTLPCAASGRWPRSASTV
jgi:N-methylhydantoinase A/oxoprolinase/acetone carboxylase beta subunit